MGTSHVLSALRRFRKAQETDADVIDAVIDVFATASTLPSCKTTRKAARASLSSASGLRIGTPSRLGAAAEPVKMVSGRSSQPSRGLLSCSACRIGYGTGPPLRLRGQQNRGVPQLGIHLCWTPACHTILVPYLFPDLVSSSTAISLGGCSARSARTEHSHLLRS